MDAAMANSDRMKQASEHEEHWNDQPSAKTRKKANTITVPKPTYAGPSAAQRYSHHSGSNPNTDFNSKKRHSLFSLKIVLPSTHDVKADILANWLHTKQEQNVWTHGHPGEGVVIKRSKGNYACAPPRLINDGTGFYRAVAELNVRCAITVSSTIISYTMQRANEPYIQIHPSLRLQVIPDFDFLPFCQKGQLAAFITSNQLLVVWQDDPKLLLEHAQAIQHTLTRTMVRSEFGDEDGPIDKKPFNGIPDYYDGAEIKDDQENEPRKLKLLQAAYTGAALLLLTVALGSGWRLIAIEQMEDPNWLRWLFVLTLPAQVWLSLFCFQALVGNVIQVAGCTGALRQNSKYYSGKAPRRLHRDKYGGPLPHVIVQMPVYKEGLRSVIEPSVRSIKKAISTYELQGGTANIFINDDGMQLISPKEARERQDFYDEHSIGWVARPKHNLMPKENEKRFYRRGKFKKASNMNYALRLSVRVEDLLANVERGEKWRQVDENAVYQEALTTAISEHCGEAWADGSIRMGDYILLVDSDTRVPTDCLLEAVSEMKECPQVAILQYSSGVMNVDNNFFEIGITFFTNMIYTMIRFAVANGDVAPFVGHNAILRWSALQEIAYECELDHWEKYWSENTVSEDFDMALRLQSEGYIVRFAGYKGDGYKEGVSLTVYEELARWEKYAYGCNELVFHPLRDWIFKGPFTKLFMSFIFSPIPLHSKFTIMSYIGTYYAIGSSWILTLTNYFLIGFFNGWLDHYYINSFRVYFAIIIVFTGAGNLALAWVRYRADGDQLFRGFLSNLKWFPMFTIFLGGMSLHVSQALFCHFFSIDIEWGATIKESQNVTIYQAIKLVFKKFKWSFFFCAVMTGVMLYMRFGLKRDWQIRLFLAIRPMGSVVVNHFFLPIVLNPQIMRMTW